MVPADLLEAGDSTPITAAFSAAIQRAVAGCTPGSVVIQIREKDLDGRLLLALVRAAQPFAPVAVNDRLDVALAANAWAVHLPERGLAVADARALAAAVAPSLVIGASRHAGTIDAELAAAELAATELAATEPAAADAHATQPAAARGRAAADIIQLGPLWPTPSKPNAPTLGEAALADLAHRARRASSFGRPAPLDRRAILVAVGGIDSPERAERAAAAGADAVAIIRAAWTGDSLAPYVAAVTAGRARR
jgi:thiamine-phosphate pyrophosphorylase